MTIRSVSATEIATIPYSDERLAAMDRADRITRLRFAARRRGEIMSVAAAMALIDAELAAEQAAAESINADQIAAGLETVEVATVAADDTAAANDSRHESPIKRAVMAFTIGSSTALVNVVQSVAKRLWQHTTNLIARISCPLSRVTNKGTKR